MDDVSVDADELFQQANRSPQLRSGVMKKAANIAAAARRNVAREGGSARISLREVTQVNGRYGVDVVSDSDAEEYGTEQKRELRSLRRAARSVR